VPNTATQNGVRRYFPRDAGEWQEHEDSNSRFVDGYGLLFEDFRGRDHNHIIVYQYA